jgi:hypothetical protein
MHMKPMPNEMQWGHKSVPLHLFQISSEGIHKRSLLTVSVHDSEFLFAFCTQIFAYFMMLYIIIYIVRLEPSCVHGDKRFSDPLLSLKFTVYVPILTPSLDSLPLAPRSQERR